MICLKCNKEIPNNSIYCPVCGSRVIKQKGNDKIINYKRLIMLIVIPIIVIGISIMIYINSTPKAKYNRAETFMSKHNYQKALKYYKAVGNYKDASEKIEIAKQAYYYEQASSLMKKTKYIEAKKELEKIGDYRDSIIMKRKCNYNIGKEYQKKGNYENAAKLYKESQFEDYDKRIIEMGEQLVKKSEYATAVKVFSNSKHWISNSSAQYANGMANLDLKRFDKAAESFDRAGEFLDAKERYKESEYCYANSQLNKERYDDAKNAFSKIKDYKDSNNMIKACKLMNAKENMKTGKLHLAQKLLTGLPSEYSYNGVIVSDLLNKINSNKDWVNICGEWGSTSGEITSNCHDRNGYYDGGVWTVDVDKNEYKIEIKCMINDDGTINVKGKGIITVFNNWSTLQSLLDYNTSYSLDFNKRILAQDFGKPIRVDKYTTLTPGQHGWSLDYLYKDANSTVSFIYVYETNIKYGKKIKSY